MKFSPIPIFIAMLFLLGTGCSTITTSSQQKQAMMENFNAGNIPEALAYAQKKHQQTAGTGDELVWLLECGSLHFLQGDFGASLNDFRRCEELIENYDDRATVSLRDTGDEMLSAFTNVNALPYRGWCRDRVAIGLYKALAYLGTGNEGAFRAQAKRLREEHQKIQDDYQKFFEAEKKQLDQAKEKNADSLAKAQDDAYLKDERNAAYVASQQQTTQVAHRGYGNFLNPASLFLSGLALLRDGTWDNASIEFSRLYQAMPNSPLAQQYYVTALLQAGREIPPELSAVQPFSFPLDDNCVYILLGHDLSASFEEMQIYFPIMIAWPVCLFHPANLTNLSIQADGATYITSPLADMDAILAQEFQMRMPGLLIRTLIGVFVKEAAYQATIAAIRHKHQKSATDELLVASATIAWKTYQALFNTADTRSWNLLPKEYQLAQLPMPSDRTLTINLNQGAVSSPVQLTLLDSCGSAIIYVNAMNPRNVAFQVLPLN